MVQNSKFAIQLLEKIGAPLAAAVESVPLKGDNNDVEAAQLIARMLGQAVQISISLNNSLNVQEDEAQADSTRLALAAVAAPLIADFYRKNERVPEDQDIKRMIKSQEAVLAFAENFTPAADGASRLSTIDPSAPLFDKTQPSLVVLQASAPIINAIAEFPFGQGEIKLVQEVVTRLEQNAADMVKNMGSADKLSELMVFKGLAEIYAECHRAETTRLATASNEDRGELSLTPVWDAYETKRAMAEALIGMVGAPEAAPQPDVQAAPEPQTAPSAPPQQDAAPSQQSQPSSPMGFFKAGPKNETAAPAAPAPAQQTPAAPQAAPSSPPASSGGNSGSPMSFFKPGAKKEEGDGQQSS